jgi:arginase
MEQALAHLGPDRPLHLSYDIDVVDPIYAPATGTLVRGGLTWREAHLVAEMLAQTKRLVAIDMVEVRAPIMS